MSSKALASAREFLCHAPHEPVPYARQQLNSDIVPATDDGLRMYAANGDWTAVLELAGKLEDAAASRSRGSQDDARRSVSSHTAALAARFPYVLVQVTAYFKLNRVAEAKVLVDTLGDLDSLRHPVTTEHLAPFSLRFLKAIMPFYFSAPQDAVNNLHALLSEVSEKFHGYKGVSGGATSTLASWHARKRRVLRALIYILFSTQQYDSAYYLFQRLIDEEYAPPTEVEALSSCHDDQQSRVRYALQLQQFACMCMKAGEEARSRALLFRVESMAEFAQGSLGTSASTAALLQHIVSMNEAFVLTFCGSFGAAAEKFRTIAALTDYSLHEESQAPSQGTAVALDDSFYCAALREIYVNAETSRMTCLSLGALRPMQEPTSVLNHMIASVEASLKCNPSTLTHSDAMLQNLVRLYTLSGERQPRLERLADVLEVFRSEAAALTNLEKLV